MPTAAIAMPYSAANSKLKKIAAAMTRIGRPVDIIPTPRPAMMFVAGPVSDCCAI